MFYGVPIAPSSDAASERVIAVGRLALSVGGLLAVALDPTQGPQVTFTYAVLIAYVIFALALLIVADRPMFRTWSLISHGLEITLVCLIIGTTEGPASPFFVYFTFLLLVATLRWQGRGALATGALLSAVLIALSASSLLIELDRTDVDRLIVRNIYLLVAAGLFAFLGDQLGRSHQRSERLRLAQELHDGLLQALTAVRLKVHAVAAATGADQRQALSSVAGILEQEQRQLRIFVEQSRADRFDGATDVADCLAELKSHAVHLRELWNCQLELRLPTETLELPARQRTGIRLIIDESVANAVTHGDASQVAITIVRDSQTVWLTIKDNGGGLPNVSGDFDHVMLDRKNLGPRSLRKRIIQMGGSLQLNTSPQGMELKIALPRLSASAELPR
jgi:signal transduction histidine kinase